MIRVTLPDGTPLAESNDTIVVEGNHYFPPSSLKEGILTQNSTSTVCAWKGTAAYYDAIISGKTVVSDVAWYYPEPMDAAANIKDYVAFYKNKVVIKSE